MSPTRSTPAGAPARRLHANGIATLEQGEGTVTVVLLHGIGGGKARPEQLAALARRLPCAGLGHARLRRQRALIDPYDFDGLAAALAPLLQAERAAGRRVVLLGHSMGGMVAQQACAATPALIDGMVLSGTSPAFGKPGGDWQRDFVAARTAPLDAGRSMAEMAAGWCGPWWHRMRRRTGWRSPPP